MTPNQPDRISVSFGMKLSLPTKYESADFHVSLASDVKPGETSTSAFNRVKKEVETYAALTYQQIRNSESGLTHDTQELENQQGNQADVPAPAEPKAAVKRDIKALRQQIKQAFGVLEAQKKTTAAGFKSEFLGGKKTDELNELEVTKAIVGLREKHPELGL